MTATILVKNWHCPSCIIGCGRVVKVESPYKVDPEYGGPEYETSAAFGSFCMNEDLIAIAKANELCNKYALDTMSAGVAIAFAMECYEKGLITKKDTGGLDLTWGNSKAVIELVEKIAKREGIGDLLAEGVKRAAEKIGGGAEKFSLHVKGMELPMHEPRGKKGVGLSFATSNRGACHLQFQHDDNWEKDEKLIPQIGLTPDISPRDRLYLGTAKAKVVEIGQNLFSAYDSLVICKFTVEPWGGNSIDTLLGILNSVTGWDVTPMEMMTVGERAFNLCRAFNVREGMSRKDDILPERLSEPLTDGLYKGQSMPKDEMEKVKDAYYEYRGWSKEGIPTKKKLDDLGLSYVVDELKKLSKL